MEMAFYILMIAIFAGLVMQVLKTLIKISEVRADRLYSQAVREFEGGDFNDFIYLKAKNLNNRQKLVISLLLAGFFVYLIWLFPLLVQSGTQLIYVTAYIVLYSWILSVIIYSIASLPGIMAVQRLNSLLCQLLNDEVQAAIADNSESKIRELLLDLALKSKYFRYNPAAETVIIKKSLAKFMTRQLFLYVFLAIELVMLGNCFYHPEIFPLTLIIGIVGGIIFGMIPANRELMIDLKTRQMHFRSIWYKNEKQQFPSLSGMVIATKILPDATIIQRLELSFPYSVSYYTNWFKDPYDSAVLLLVYEMIKLLAMPDDETLNENGTSANLKLF